MKTNGASKIIGAMFAVAIATGATYANAQTGGMPNDASMQPPPPAPAAAAGPHHSNSNNSRNANRSDSTLLRDIRQTFTRTPGLNFAAIHVNVHHGAVTLTGTVPQHSQIKRAGDAAHSVRGVRSVKNKLTVRERHGRPQ
ncbi:transporter [Burkholderia sp. SRS-W-2-2016]|uniref:BON domain-containing protein n=1 Tax=Burkholderia sp. SRS-W-2-2016 TaxID=1926878 RepID=UPI00094B1AEC|nr:BON domain-containing protein [Burkholderia sp. SRS-W-2-2016]OLL31981.1 transporter [Burkholderia sp. SRS-W-2-2016]